MEALNNVTSTYLVGRQWDQAELWLNRLDSVFTLCRATPYAADFPYFMDWYLSSVRISRAMIAEVRGKKAEASRSYNEFLTTDFAKTDEGHMVGCYYLMLS